MILRIWTSEPLDASTVLTAEVSLTTIAIFREPLAAEELQVLLSTRRTPLPLKQHKFQSSPES